MRCVVESPRSLYVSRLVLMCAITLGAAACSSDSSRFGDSGYQPTGMRPTADVTGSVTPQPQAPAVSASALPPPAPEQQAPPQPMPPSGSVWSPPPPTRVATAAPSAPAAAPTTTPAAGKTMHTVVNGDTLHKIARQYRVRVSDIMSANSLTPNSKLKVGRQLVIPAHHAMPPAPQKPLVLGTTDKSPPAGTIRKITPTPELPSEAKDVSASGSLTFRWPVRGRVIAGFGPKPSGQQNDGINFAVPEGTPIKAAEEGVVAYAGSELKTYGNLVLIRHPSGYVTAYAHASEILVKRDEPVKRGQVIAKSGQTGNVASPQLHFEIRKGATPVDPMPFLERSGT